MKKTFKQQNKRKQARQKKRINKLREFEKNAKLHWKKKYKVWDIDKKYFVTEPYPPRNSIFDSWQLALLFEDLKRYNKSLPNTKKRRFLIVNVDKEKEFFEKLERKNK